MTLLNGQQQPAVDALREFLAASSEVILMEVDALVAVVDAKLRAPLEVTLGPDGLQRLFSQSGILTSNAVRELLI